MARVVRRHKMRIAMWDVSANTNKDQTADDIVQRVVHNARGGSIIDLRDGVNGVVGDERATLVQALPGILEGLRSKHLEPVRLDQLVGGPAYTSCSGHAS